MEESKEYSWAWVTADQLLSLGPCELVYALVTCDGSASYVTLYNGEDTTGGIIAILKASGNISQQMHVPVPVYCDTGLYLDIYDTHVTGVFIMWRELK